jgi:MOSC domain-containing protein YiiM
MNKGKVLAVNIGEKVGRKKTNAGRGYLLLNRGLQGDAHAGTGRQVSLLAEESIKKIREKGLDVGFGDFAENITTEGIDLPALPIGIKLRIGKSLLRITQIGKVCHDRCHIFFTVGDCVMPREGVFAEVLQEGGISAGDEIEVVD